MFSQVLSLVREGELSLRVYKCEVQVSHFKIMKCQKAIEDKDVFLVENKAKILKL